MTYKQTDRLTHKQVVRKTDRQTQTDMQAGRQLVRKTDGQTEKDRQTDTDRRKGR